MVQIYSETNTNYEYNGDVVLDPEVCDLKVTLNGSWEVTLECPLDEQNKFQSILTNAVLCTDTPVGKKQLFRLYDVQRTEIGVIAYARPIFLDSARDVFFPDCRPTDLDGQAALDYLMKGTPYSGYTDITLTKTAYYVRKNLIEALAGNEDNSFLNRWGGEITYDNYKINILVQQGEDNGLRVEFGTNIQSIQETIDVDEMGTRLVPVAFNGRTLDGDEPWVDSPLIDNYPIVYTKIVNFDDMRLLEDFNADEDGNYDESEMEDYEVFDTLAELQEAMIERCKQLFLDGVDLPAITYNVDMLDLRIADDYKDYQDLETVNLGDTVYCYHRKLGIETKARVIEYTYDCIRQCITSLTIGDYQEDYLDHLADITSSSGGTVDFTQIWDRFDYIEANYVKTNQLEAEVGKFGYLTVAEADITYARITDLEAALIQVNELIADQIYAVYADIGVLDASVANIISLLGGDIATGTLDTIHLTADNAIIDSEVVLQAIIEEAIIGDLLAGVIYTDYVTIMDNENRNMILTGPTIQFIDSEGNYRMQVGLDGAGNFNIYIFDELGNLLFDALGLTEAGLIGNGAIIRDVAVADDANISGYKLNIQEVAECLTADGTLIVDAGQVIIDGSTLSAVYTEIRQDVNTALTDAEKALEAAGGLIEVGARNYLLNTRQLDMEEDKTVYSDTDWTLSQDESDYGVLEENGNGSVLMLTAISAEKNSLSGKKMVFATDLLEENLTSILDDYDLEFGIYKSDDGGETWEEYGVINSTMNEDTVFEFNRSDLSDNEWCRLIAKFTANAEHMHTTSQAPVFTWDDDNMKCTATYTCDSCGENIVEDCDVQEETIEATCEDDGSITYTATVTIGGVEYTDKKVVVIPATGHSYGEPYDVLWSSDYSKCTFYFACTLCGEKYEEAVTPEYETVDATCTENGKTTYTAKCTINGTIYTATTEVTIPALGHEYGDPVFDWANDYMSCKVTVSCIRGDDSETVDCSIEIVTIAPSCTTDGMTTYTATAVFDGKTYIDEKTETIPATGHTYGDAVFVWASDFSTCEATFTCEFGDDTQTVQCTVTSKTDSASCTEPGTITYTATCEFNGKSYSDKVEVETEALGHEYGEPEFEWADDYSECTAVFSCIRGDDVKEVQCAIKTEMVEPTDTENGKYTYTATCTVNGETYTDTKEDIIPATGHTYGTPAFEWATDYETCVAVFECINGDDTQRIDCTVTKQTADATCENDGQTEYIASVTFDGETYSESVFITIPAIGHNYGNPTFDWASDYSSCDAVFVCSNCGDSVTVACTIETSITPAGCTTDGKQVYTATVELEGNTYTDTKTETIPATGHNYGEPTFNWTEGSKKAVIDIPYEPSGDIIESGQLGDDVWYDIYENGYCRVYGTGETYSYASMNPSNYSPLRANNTIKVLVIEDNITAINDAVFIEASAIEYIYMNNSSVSYLGSNLFQNCTSLKEVFLSSNLATIASRAFSTCTALTKITFIGNAPTNMPSEMGQYYQFVNVTATCYYPADNDTWNDFDFGDYGGTLTWQATEYEYEESGCSCTATFTCENCGDTQTVDCTVTETDDEYIATVEFEGNTYTDTKEKDNTGEVGGKYEFAIYSADDSSLTFYTADEVPIAGSSYNGKTVTNIYTDFANSTWTGTSQNPWYSIRSNIKLVEFDLSFKRIKPVSLAFWFYNFSVLTNVLDASNLDTSNVTTMNQTFWGCSLLESIDVSNWDTSNVTTMYYLFTGCNVLKYIDVSNWDVSKVEDMRYLFSNTRALTSLDVSNWNASSVTDLSGMFQYCNSISDLNLSGFDTSNVTSMSNMFYSCSNLTSLDLSSFDTSNVTSMSSMFYGCSNLVTVYVQNGQFNTDKVTEGTQTFRNCSSIVGGNGTVYNSSNYSYTMAHIDTVANPGYFTDIADKP